MMRRVCVSLLCVQVVLSLWGCKSEDTQTSDDTAIAQDTGSGDDTRLPDTSAADTSLEDSADSAVDVEQDTRPPVDPSLGDYPLEDNVYTTLQRVWVPKQPPESTLKEIRDGDLLQIELERFDAMGLGAELGPGEPWIEKNELAPEYATPSTAPVSLAYFWQNADSQLIDEESPIRFEGVYLLAYASVFKPQSHVTTQIFEAHVRTARRISELSGRPFDFAVASGDLADGGQTNEVTWFTQLMNGGPVDPDSGADDDPIPGPGNDHTDPFFSRGIGVPWYASIGNHETLYVGLFPPTDEIKAAAVGDEVVDVVGDLFGFIAGEGLSNGYRDGRTPLGDVVNSGTTPADPDRHIANVEETLSILQAAGGLGPITAEQAAAGRGYFAVYPIEGKPLKLIVLNTLSYIDPAEKGYMDDAQFGWLVDELDDSEAKGELVIVTNHHGVDAFTAASPVGSDVIEDTLSRYDSVILHLTGHGHHYALTERPSTRSSIGLGHWELMCPSTVDFPSQTRIFELVYEGDGYLAVYVTSLDHHAAEGTLAAFGRHLSVGRKIFGSPSFVSTWESEKPFRNLLLRYKLNTKQVAAIESETWPTRIESLETLATFE